MGLLGSQEIASTKTVSSTDYIFLDLCLFYQDTLNSLPNGESAMEGIANVAAVIDVSARVATLCFRYYQSVNYAGLEIRNLLECTGRLKTTLESVQDLLDGPFGNQLKTSQKLRRSLDSTREHLDDAVMQLERKLRIGRKTRYISRIQALRWPFDSKSITKTFENLQLDQASLDSALQIDQTAEILNIHIKLAMATLPVAKEAAFNSHANEHDPKCHPGTRAQLLAEICKQLENPGGKCILWLQGIAGTGKSTIARSIAAHFSKAKGIATATFFFKKGEGDRDKASLLFTTIASQLLQRLPFMAPYVMEALNEDPAIINKSIKDQFQNLIIDPLKRCKKIPGFPTLIVVVIDALDECRRGNDAAAIIHSLPQAAELITVRLRFFITSRPEFHIRRSFKRVRATDFVLHEVPKADISKDISTFLRFRLDGIRDEFNDNVCSGSELPPDWPGPARFQALVRKAVPLFIFASTACDFIEDINCGDPDEQLHKLLDYNNANGLPQLYTTYLPILNQLLLVPDKGGSKSKPRSQSTTLEVMEWFRVLVGTIILLADPLSPGSLAKLLGKSLRSIESRLSGLHSVLHIPQSPDLPVRLFHLSFRDFLVDAMNRDNNPFWIDEQKAHSKIAGRCVELLSTENALKMDICFLGRPGRPRSEIDQMTIYTQLPPEVQYACIYLAHHLQQSGKPLLDDSQVYCFLTTHLLHWLEALAILGRIRETTRMLGALLDLVDWKRSPRLWALLRDAQRGILMNRSIIDEYPLQIYCSAITFAPETSEVRNIFKSQLPRWITLLPRVDADWNPCVQTFEGIQGDNSIATFSPDGSHIVTASSNKIQFWDTMSGVCTISMTIYDNNIAMDKTSNCHIDSIAISPGGGLLAVAASNREDDLTTLQLWDVITGTCISGFGGHRNQVNAVTFSPDGRLLASASGYTLLQGLQPKDTVVRLWDIATESCIQTLTGHRHPIQSIAFSADSKLLSSVSSDGTALVWDLYSGIPIGPALKGFKFVTFSPKTRQIASLQDEFAISILDIETGTGILTHGALHTNSITSITFSPDGSYLASASKDNTVKMWDVATGACIKTLEGHLNSVNSVAFAPDGSSIISASRDSTVKVWDIVSDRTTGFEGHDTPPTFVTFSLDGSLLLSEVTSKLSRWLNGTTLPPPRSNPHNPYTKHIFLSPDCKRLVTIPGAPDEFYSRIQVWDVKSGAYIKIFENQATPVAPTRPQQVTLWDTTSGDCLRRFQPGFSVGSASFSPDSNRLAVGCLGAIAVLEAESGRTVAELGCSYQWITAVAFSYDNVSLASAAQSGYLEIWSIPARKQLGTLHTRSSNISSIEFSRDGRWLAAGSLEGRFWIWDIKTGHNIKPLDLDTPIYSIAFDKVGLYPKINTEIGTFTVQGSLFTNSTNVAERRTGSQLTMTRQGIGMSKCGTWITWDSDKVLWVPPVFRRSGQMTSALTESTVALSNRSGRLTIISMSSPNTPPSRNTHVQTS
ncbi:vegetative incompatibility protein HET-E-1 [Nannizzia gypsea CBS 118893]|uniref:Vegetative incompatibility protein HET-E-1 n=1 Tax=Arthroderma gypseum (strain ATCC MYA-4604 / CBS 118893) TaxID=535722 RepID=E4V1X6_ARTGP|nr:vegetative incompatibility protein HET-E-1 [Nannizzia gypsea CBS 118893]EFR04041.1 vegetative incompatibility protein HET-E-1 [Nannizzia gypsea CBS 118893]